MPELELRAILITAASLAPLLAGHRVLVHTDSTGAEFAILKRNARHPHERDLLRQLALISQSFHIDWHATHIDTKANSRADAISRDQIPAFLREVGEVKPKFISPRRA